MEIPVHKTVWLLLVIALNELERGVQDRAFGGIWRMSKMPFEKPFGHHFQTLRHECAIKAR